MVRHALKHIFQKPTPDIDSSDRTQQLRAKTIYAGTVDLAQTLAKGNNSLYKTYTGPYEVVKQAGNSNLIASRSYDDLLSITKGKVLLNQLPLNSSTQNYYQKNFAKGQMYEGNYNQFDPSFNTGCNNSVLVYDIGSTGFTGPASYDTNGGFIGVTGPTGTNDNNKRIFIDPNHCFYSDPCLLDALYTRFVNPVLSGLTGSGPFNAQQIISADQYRGFSYPMPNFSLTCSQPILNQEVGPLFCSPETPGPNPNPNPLIVAVGSGVDDTNTIATSQDGITWSGLGNTTFSEDGFDVAWNGSTWVAVGNGINTIATSINGTDWIPRSSVNSMFNNGFGVASNGSNTWVAVGQGANSIANSIDNGITWTGLGNMIFSSTGGDAGVAYGSGMWVAVGEGGNTIATSPNGVIWTGHGNTILTQGAGVAYGSNLWVAVGGGAGDKIVTSSNGTSWSPSASGNSIFTNACGGIAWNGSNRWVAVGDGTGAGRIATSSDGTTWISSNNGSTIFTASCTGVTWSSSLQLWVAVGGGTNFVIATSTNGMDWVGRVGNTLFSFGRGVASN